MAKPRVSISKRQREQQKAERTREREERRAARAAEGETTENESLIDPAAGQAALADLHARYEAGEIDLDELDARREELQRNIRVD